MEITDGDWVDYKPVVIEHINQDISHNFHPDFRAYWIRFASDTDTNVDAHLVYR